jgi:DNA (cytosine-5)-methyltransferase 1
MSKPRLLDLFCGAGGTAMGYARAGFEVMGVDILPQPCYPFNFVQADAFEFLQTVDIRQYDVLRASPVCKGFSLAGYFHHSHDRHDNQIPLVRDLFRKSGKPYEIENVDRAPLIRAIMLCGVMFGLHVYRHRYFESNLLLFQPEHSKHVVRAARPGAIARDGEFWCVGGHFGHKREAAAAMGIDWMDDQESIAQAVPPAYTYWIAQQFLLIWQGKE